MHSELAEHLLFLITFPYLHIVTRMFLRCGATGGTRHSGCQALTRTATSCRSTTWSLAEATRTAGHASPSSPRQARTLREANHDVCFPDLSCRAGPRAKVHQRSPGAVFVFVVDAAAVIMACRSGRPSTDLARFQSLTLVLALEALRETSIVKSNEHRSQFVMHVCQRERA